LGYSFQEVFMDANLKNRTILVTEATNGFGLVVARHLARMAALGTISCRNAGN
jgi:NAD(P)-dependent dehydrogenase (short-subunit alcohol dehydrogenase family)